MKILRMGFVGPNWLFRELRKLAILEEHERYGR